MMQYFNKDCAGLVLDSGKGEYIVKGKLKNNNNSKILFMAPNSPNFIDWR